MSFCCVFVSCENDFDLVVDFGDVVRQVGEVVEVQ